MSAFGRCLCISLTAPLYYQTIVAFLCGVFEQFANRFRGVFKGGQLTGAAGREFSPAGRQGVSPRMSWGWGPSLPGRRAGSFSEDRPLGWDPVARRAIGRAMEWPDSCPRRKLPVHNPVRYSYPAAKSGTAFAVPLLYVDQSVDFFPFKAALEMCADRALEGVPTCRWRGSRRSGTARLAAARAPFRSVFPW